jgi:competence protein ComEA
MPKQVHRTLVVLCSLAAVLLVAALCEARPAAKAAGPPAATAGSTAAPAGVVNVNTATEAQLQLLPRIGPAKARAIVKHRSRAKFRNPWDLTRVKGIGRKSFRSLRPYVAVKGETTLTAKVKLSQK